MAFWMSRMEIRGTRTFTGNWGWNSATYSTNIGAVLSLEWRTYFYFNTQSMTASQSPQKYLKIHFSLPHSRDLHAARSAPGPRKPSLSADRSSLARSSLLAQISLQLLSSPSHPSDPKHIQFPILLPHFPTAYSKMFAARRALSGAAQRRAFSATARDVSCTFDISPSYLQIRGPRDGRVNYSSQRWWWWEGFIQLLRYLGGDSNCWNGCERQLVGGLMCCSGHQHYYFY